FLFVVLWRVAGPPINGVITSRRGTINAHIAAAENARGDAESASGAYPTALAGGRAPAPGLAGGKPPALNAETAKAKAAAEAGAHTAMTAADARISETRIAAKEHVVRAAAEAAIAIVARLTGETVTAGDAARAVEEA